MELVDLENALETALIDFPANAGPGRIFFNRSPPKINRSAKFLLAT